ncbi:hypothetical protein ACO34A_24630 (plasmid) [Rhizobium sp. ACO-34A]|nr:dienelactone hydrolase family protein [Rhizobium sp. ACO-34A]ATN36962.1 hypothetical protein ACO34A_24630 [Rhizobium sp. ACO-34A]
MSGRPLSYHADGRDFEGVVVTPSALDEGPGLLMVPNWLGVTENAVARGERFAAIGYLVLVVDVFGVDSRPANMEEAAVQAENIRDHPQTTRDIMAAAAMALQAQSSLLKSAPLATIGFCLGGGIALEYARSGANLAAAVSVHGDLITSLPAVQGEVKASLLALHGSTDPISPKAQRDAFEAEMTHARADWHLMVFGDRRHAFTDLGADNEVAKYDRFADEWSYFLSDRFIKDALARRGLSSGWVLA